MSYLLPAKVSAEIMKPIKEIDLHGWQINFSSSMATAFKGQQTVRGELDTQQGNFSFWIFTNIQKRSDDGVRAFKIILNEKTGIIFYFNTIFEAGGPFLDGISLDGNMVAFDFGTGSVRGVEVWDSSGNKLMKMDSYLGELHWEQNTLIYDFPVKELPIDLNKETKACGGVGAAWLVKQKRFSRKGIKIFDSISKIVCSN